jgi:DNA-binding CsgD family transcriptional regulator
MVRSGIEDSLNSSVHVDDSLRLKVAEPLGKNIVLLTALWTVHAIWFQLINYNTLYPAPFDFMPGVQLEQLAFNCAAAVSFLAIMVFDRQVLRLNRTLFPLTTLILLLGSALFAIAGYQTIIPRQVFASIGTFIVGIGYAWMYLSSFRIFKNRASLWEVVIVLVVSRALSRTALTVLLAVLNQGSLIIVTLLTALAFGWLLYLSQKQLAIHNEPRLPTLGIGMRLTNYAIMRSHAFRVPLIMTVVITPTVTIMRGLSGSGPWGRVFVTSLWLDNLLFLLLALLVYATVSFGVYYFCTHKKGSVWSQMPFMVIIACLAVLQFLRADYLDTAAYVLFGTAMEFFCQLVYSLTLVQVIRLVPLSTYKVMGFARAFSIALLILQMTVFDWNESPAWIVVLGVIYLAMMGISLLARDQQAKARTEDGMSENSSSLSERIDYIVHKTKLTKREAEILNMLIKGRSLPAIQKELHIASGTANVHIRHIYEKLKVHSRQELMSIVYPISEDDR